VNLVLVLVLVVAGAAHASHEGPRTSAVLSIEGMEPISAADLTRFSGLAVRLAAAGRSNPSVRLMLEETLAQVDRGIVKRAVAYLALCAMGQDGAARRLIGTGFRDRAVMRIAQACAADLANITHLPR
jgi:hypothetical protein